MRNEEKLKALKAFLTENKIKFSENYQLKKPAVSFIPELYLNKYRIVVHLSDEHDQEFYLATRCHYHPFFIRENEKKEFIIEKMQNCIIDRMKQFQKKWDKKNNKSRI
jgi:hypothetical protein